MDVRALLIKSPYSRLTDMVYVRIVLFVWRRRKQLAALYNCVDNADTQVIEMYGRDGPRRFVGYRLQQERRHTKYLIAKEPRLPSYTTSDSGLEEPEATISCAEPRAMSMPRFDQYHGSSSYARFVCQPLQRPCYQHGSIQPPDKGICGHCVLSCDVPVPTCDRRVCQTCSQRCHISRLSLPVVPVEWTR